jgi:hypothetical protein
MIAFDDQQGINICLNKLDPGKDYVNKISPGNLQKE